jgi:hypothetical protein
MPITVSTRRPSMKTTSMLAPLRVSAAGMRDPTRRHVDVAVLVLSRGQRSAPANAIIAPLSVQNSGAGTRAEAVARRACAQLAQRAVGADAAGDHERVAPGLLERAPALDRERLATASWNACAMSAGLLVLLVPA